MKRLFFTLTAVAALTLVLASCSKDRTCTCTTTTTFPGGTDTEVDVITYNDARKGDARENCMSYTRVDGTTTTKQECDLK